MGSWNATCGLSGLPIHYTDPVVGLIIRRESPELTPHGPWDNYTPASLMVRGAYCDYGSLELGESDLELLRLTQERASVRIGNVTLPDGKTRRGLQRIHPYPVEFRQGSKSLQRLDERYFQTRDDETTRTENYFSLWLAHERVYDRLAQECEDYVYQRGDVKLPVLVDIERENILAVAAEHPRLANYFTRGTQFVGPAAEWLAENISEGIRDGDGAMLSWAWDRWAELFSLYKIMDLLRMGLCPTAGWGSQDADYQPHQVLSEIKGELIAEKLAEYAEEEEID